jgi:hypothetical protein
MTTPSNPLSSQRNIRNPFLPGLWPLLGITALMLIGFLVVGGLAAIGTVPGGALLLAGLPVALFGAISIIAALWGERQVQQIQNFLDSDRPQVRWTYTAEEWAALRETRWQEAQEYRLLPMGCLAFLLGIAGLLVGGALGANNTPFSAYDWETLLEIGMSGVAGALVGGLAGGLIGGVVTLGNWQTARQNYRREEPEEVALSKREIYAAGQYVKMDGDSTELTQVEWEQGHPMRLLLTTSRRFPRRSEETWDIVVPERVLAQVEAVVLQMEESLTGRE